MANSSTCFDNFIGIKGCDQTSGSGLFIQELPGITMRKSSSVADDGTGEDLLRDKINFATKLVADEFNGHLLPHFRANTVAESKFIGKYSDPVAYEPPVAAERGVKVKRTGGPLARIHVQRVRVLVNTTGTHQLKITDGSTETFYDVEVTTAGEEVEVCTEYTATEREIFITMDNTAISVAKSKVKSHGCSCSGVKALGQLVTYGWNGARQTNESYGLKVDLMVHCDQDQLLCVLKSRLGLPILYRSGAEFMSEVANTDRLNYYTLVEDKEHAHELSQQFMDEYNKRMKILVEGILPLVNNIDKYCVVCNHGRYVEALP